jgi:hypothetical protein
MDNINSEPTYSRSVENSGNVDLGILQKKVLREG